MLVTRFVDRVAEAKGLDGREIERYARYLREAGLFPERIGGRKVSIKPSSAANLLLAIAAAPNAAHAAKSVQNYGSLLLQWSEARTEILYVKGELDANRRQWGYDQGWKYDSVTFIEFFTALLASEDIHPSFWDIIRRGCLHVYRGVPVINAVHASGITFFRFRPEGVEEDEDHTRIFDLSAVQGDLLIDLADDIAGLNRSESYPKCHSC